MCSRVLLGVALCLKLNQGLSTTMSKIQNCKFGNFKKPIDGGGRPVLGCLK
jgi:hypothetical protein